MFFLGFSEVRYCANVTGTEIPGFFNQNVNLGESIDRPAAMHFQKVPIKFVSKLFSGAFWQPSDALRLAIYRKLDS